MENKQIENFLASADELINCKFLVAEYKLSKLLQALANSDQIVSLIGECMEAFNRDREFAKSFLQDGKGDFIFVMPEEEYKVIALVFCTLIDIENKKIDFTDFVKRFFGGEENAFQGFISRMIIPFRDLIAEAFGYPKIGDSNTVQSDINTQPATDENVNNFNEEESEDTDDEFIRIQKIAVQILSQLQYSQNEKHSEKAMAICRSIIKTTSLRDNEVTYSLIFALKMCKLKQGKFLVKEMCEISGL